MTARPTLVVVSPIEPSRRGNGLAMRVATFVDAAAIHHDVALVVVPVAGALPSPDRPDSTARFEVPPVAAGPASHRALDAWLADALWRDRLERSAPLPPPVARVPLGAAETVHAAIDRPVGAVLACRLTTSMLGLRLAEAFGCPLVVDLDDDDTALALEHGDHDGAANWQRVASTVLAHTSLALAASEDVLAAIEDRHHPAARLAVVPNAAPRHPHLAIAPPPVSSPRALMVANFGYAPNRAGAEWLLSEVLPRLDPSWEIELVGPGTPPTGASPPRVEVRGFVADLTERYRQATVSVAPLLTGSGTRIKILEAMSLGSPVVATSAAARGLEVEAGRHLLVADDAAEFARSMQRCLDPTTSGALTRAARELVATAYDRDLVVDRIARLLEGSHGGASPAPGTLLGEIDQ